MPAEEFERTLEGLRGEQEAVPESHIHLYEEVFKAQAKAKRRIFPKAFRISKKELDRRFEEGLPILSLDRVKIPTQGLEKLFAEICSALQKHSGENPADIQVLEDAEKNGELDLVELIRSVASGEGRYCQLVSESLNVNYELLLFLGMGLARPIFELWAGSLRGKVKDDGWLRPHCPVCGSEPYMARLHKEDGRRILACPLCGTEWAFMRMECPFCRNNDQRTLRYFFVDQDSPYRVDVCDRCKRYIKTVDERKVDRGETSLSVEDMATIYLDVLAEREGYLKQATRT